MKICYTLFFLFNFLWIYSQVTLDADGAGNTYELINSVLAPGYNAIEVPDCNHVAFGRHIDEVYDADLNADVFRFYIHVNEDDDRCINFDRQRNEIKTYDQSPDNLKGVEGELIEYKWKFKIDANFQPSSSFTHLHQLKAVGGTESSMPLITLTARKATPNRLELRYAETTTQVTLTQVDLAPFQGEWVEVTQTVLYGEIGTFNISIDKVSDGTNLLSYSDNAIRMWKTGASFIRPKWGIYRSLNNVADLRNEEVFFNNFSIDEIITTPVEFLNFEASVVQKNKVELKWKTASEFNNDYFEIQKSTDGIRWFELKKIKGAGHSNETISYQFLDEQPYNKTYYKIKQIDFDGTHSFSEIKMIVLKGKEPIIIYPNPARDKIIVNQKISEFYSIKIFNTTGEEIENYNILQNEQNKEIQIDISSLESGIYYLKSGEEISKFFVLK